MEKYGFVYIWYDSKHKRYYVGSHWGTENDGYVCSSKWMLQAYKRRPEDFRRRIISKINTNRQDLLNEENKWLQLIKSEEIKVKYYNLRNHEFGHWTADEAKSLIIGKKISSSQKNNPNFGSWNKGKIRSHETKQKISESTKKSMKDYYKIHPRTEETRKKIGENSKRLQIEGKIGMKGKKHSYETKKKMSENNAMNDPKSREKIKNCKKGIKWLKKDNDRKMAIPGTKKYEELINIGYALNF